MIPSNRVPHFRLSIKRNVAPYTALLHEADKIMINTLGNKSYRNILFAVIVVLGVALSIIVSALSYYADKKLMQAEFNEAAENRYSALKRELDSDLAVLASLQALYYIIGKGHRKV